MPGLGKIGNLPAHTSAAEKFPGVWMDELVWKGWAMASGRVDESASGAGHLIAVHGQCFLWASLPWLNLP